jgi:hypothetical protein
MARRYGQCRVLFGGIEVRRLYSARYPVLLLVLYPHLQAVTEVARSRQDAQTARLVAVLAATLYMISDYAGAQLTCERALALREPLLGPDHPHVWKPGCGWDRRILPAPTRRDASDRRPRDVPERPFCQLDVPARDRSIPLLSTL